MTRANDGTSFPAFPPQTINTDARERVDFLLDAIGIAVAAEVIPQRLSLGVSLRRDRLRWRHAVELTQELGLAYGRSGEITFFGTNFVRSTSDAQDAALSINAGLLYKPSDRLSGGLVYKHGGRHTIPGHVSRMYFALDSHFPSPFSCPVDRLPRPAGVHCVVSQHSTTTTFDIPDFYGAGIAWRPTEHLLVTGAATRITYSDLRSTGAEFQYVPTTQIRVEPAADGNEYRLGAEYTLLIGQRGTPLSILAGTFTDNDHDGLGTIDSAQRHFSFGVGTVVSNHIQIDVGAQVARTTKEWLLSFVFR